MDETQFVCVQQNARGLVFRQLRQAFRLARAIRDVAGDRKAEVLEVNANLVGPARVP